MGRGIEGGGLGGKMGGGEGDREGGTYIFAYWLVPLILLIPEGPL